MSDHGARNFVRASKGELDIVATALAIGGASRFAGAAHRSGINELFDEDGPFTVFVPTDEAFLTVMAQHPHLFDDNVSLKELLLRHVVPGTVKAAEIVHSDHIKPMTGPDLAIENRDGRVFVDGAAVLRGDIPAKNGVLHFVNGVFLAPQGAEAESTKSK